MSPRTLASLLLLVSSNALAYPYTPWGGATGGGVLAFNPYMELHSDGVDFNPWVLYGISDRLDLIAGYTNTVDRPVPQISGPGRFDGLARFAVTDAFIGALYLGGGPEEGMDLGVEIHGAFWTDRFQFTHNTGWSTNLSDSSHSFFTVLAPEVRFAEGAWVFVEESPSLYLASGTAEWELTLTPGLTAAFDPDENHLISVALPIGVYPERSYTFGVAYWGAFPLRR
jgi:hypothetical protein